MVEIFLNNISGWVLNLHKLHTLTLTHKHTHTRPEFQPHSLRGYSHTSLARTSCYLAGTLANCTGQ